MCIYIYIYKSIYLYTRCFLEVEKNTDHCNDDKTCDTPTSYNQEKSPNVAEFQMVPMPCLIEKTTPPPRSLTINP